MYIILSIFTFFPLFLVEEDLLNIKNKSNKIKWYYLLSSILLIVFAIFRHPKLGHDLKNYLHAFNNNKFLFEIGYNYLIEIVKFFGGNFQVFIGTVSIISLIPILASFYYISNKKWLSLLMFQSLYHYAASFSLLRQFISIGLIMIATIIIKYYFAHEFELSKYKKILLLLLITLIILISSLFHFSSLFMLILPIIILVGKRYYYIVGLGVIGIILFIFRDVIIDLVVVNYFGKEYYANKPIEIGLFPILLFSSILFNQFIYRIKSTEILFLKHENEYRFVTNLAFVWLIFIFIFSWFPVFARITMVVSIMMCAFLPNFINYKKPIYVFLIFGLLVYSFFSYSYRDYQGIYPYQPMWEVTT